MRRSALLIATLAAACAPPSVVVTVEDPFELATDADTLEVDGFNSPLTGAGFPLRVTLTAEREVQDRRIEVAALRDGAVVAFGFSRADFRRDGTATASVQLGAPCGTSERGAPCTLTEGGDAGVCIEGRCLPTACGDGFTDPDNDEVCDDGNRSDDDACTNECAPNVCGDGHVHVGVEACDDGNLDDTDDCVGCAAARCGDEAIQAGVEECDDGNLDEGDGCRSDCTLNICGDNVLNPGEEDCDDGNTDSFDGCSSTCSFTVWAYALGEAPAPGFVLIHDDELLDDEESLDAVRRGEIGPDPTEILAASASGVVVALDAQTGLERWRYDAGAPLLGRAGYNGVYFLFATDDGRVHFVRDGVGASLALPPGLRPASPVIPSALTSLGPSGHPAVFLTEDAGVRRVDPPGCVSDAGTPCLGRPGIEPPGLTPCPADAGCGTWAMLPGFFIISAMGEVVMARAGCVDVDQRYVRFALSDPEEYIQGTVAFLGNGDLSIDASDIAVGVSNLGNAYRFEVPATPFGFGDNCPIVSAPPPEVILDGGVVAEPVIAPVSTYTVILPHRDGQLLKRAGAVDQAADLTQLWLEPGRALDHTPTLDAEGFLYFGDDDANLHKVHLISGLRELEVPLSANVHGSPLVGQRAVFVLLQDGTVTALERGGSRIPRGGAWHRASGSSDGLSAASCASQRGARPLFALLLLLGLVSCSCRRRRADER